jgi:hypothetical protein
MAHTDMAERVDDAFHRDNAVGDGEVLPSLRKVVSHVSVSQNDDV